MKKLQKLKLNKLSVEALENREMNQLAGGCTLKCHCGCRYDHEESGSSTSANAADNKAKGLSSSGGIQSGDYITISRCSAYLSTGSCSLSDDITDGYNTRPL